MNKSLSILAGIVSGGLVIFLSESLASKAYKMPEGINLNDPKQLDVIMHLAPASALLLIILGWLLGSFAAGMVTKMVSKEKKLNNSLLAGVILMAMGLIDLISFYHPVWFWIAGLLVFIPGSYMGYKIIMEKNTGNI